MKQWWEFKAQNMDTILFFKVTHSPTHPPIQDLQ